jgi:hypothetical protein
MVELYLYRSICLHGIKHRDNFTFTLFGGKFRDAAYYRMLSVRPHEMHEILHINLMR